MAPDQEIREHRSKTYVNDGVNKSLESVRDDALAAIAADLIAFSAYPPPALRRLTFVRSVGDARHVGRPLRRDHQEDWRDGLDPLGSARQPRRPRRNRPQVADRTVRVCAVQLG